VVPILFKVGALTPLTIDLSINPGIHLFEPTELSRGKQLAGIHIAFTKKNIEFTDLYTNLAIIDQL
jgi:hypothetical protein